MLQVSKWGHGSFECPKNKKTGQRGAYAAQPDVIEAPPQEVENVLNRRSLGVEQGFTKAN